MEWSTKSLNKMWREENRWTIAKMRRTAWAHCCRAAQPYLDRKAGHDTSIEPTEKLAFMMCTHPRLGSRCPTALVAVAQERGLVDRIFQLVEKELFIASWLEAQSNDDPIENYWTEGRQLSAREAPAGAHPGATAEKWVFEATPTEIEHTDESMAFYCARLHAALCGRFVVIPLPRHQNGWDGSLDVSVKYHFRFWNEDGSTVWQELVKWRDSMEYQAETPTPDDWTYNSAWCQVQQTDAWKTDPMSGTGPLTQWIGTASGFWDAMWNWRYRQTARIAAWDEDLRHLEEEAKWIRKPQLGDVNARKMMPHLNPPAPGISDKEFKKVCGLKMAANQAFKDGDINGALEMYEQALCVYNEPHPIGTTYGHGRDGSSGEQFEEKLKLMSNRAECLLRLSRWADAHMAANDVLSLRSTDIKARVRLIKADMQLVTDWIRTGAA